MCIRDRNCAYRIVRYGNVLHSTGSVLVKWKYALENRKELILTDQMCIRDRSCCNPPLIWKGHFFRLPCLFGNKVDSLPGCCPVPFVLRCV